MKATLRFVEWTQFFAVFFDDAQTNENIVNLFLQKGYIAETNHKLFVRMFTSGEAISKSMINEVVSTLKNEGIKDVFEVIMPYDKSSDVSLNDIIQKKKYSN